MKTLRISPLKSGIPFLLILFISLRMLATVDVGDRTEQEVAFKQYSGIVVNNKTGEPLVFASLVVENTNISTITNKEGEFSLKIPVKFKDANILVSFLGFKDKFIPIASLEKKNNRITLQMSIIKLSEVLVRTPMDAKALVKKVFKRKKVNNLNEHVNMTAFYRETIKKKRRNVSLAEAIINIYKEPYTNSRKDNVKLIKARKSTDYTRLDTIAVKLQGGPFNALSIDIMKYPQYLFTDDSYDLYQFYYSPSTTIGNKQVYVVNFKQHRYIKEPFYFGKLYIDATSLALKSAIFHLDVSNKEEASKLFVKRKPTGVSVYPLDISYRVDYLEKDGKWHYNYSNASLTFKVKRKRKWFSSTYSINSEMAITDWKRFDKKERLKYNERMRRTIIIADEASGFSDPEFWGAYNVIEPEKSIESAIKKIKRQLKKLNKKRSSS